MENNKNSFQSLDPNKSDDEENPRNIYSNSLVPSSSASSSPTKYNSFNRYNQPTNTNTNINVEEETEKETQNLNSQERRKPSYFLNFLFSNSLLPLKKALYLSYFFLDILSISLLASSFRFLSLLFLSPILLFYILLDLDSPPLSVFIFSFLSENFSFFDFKIFIRQRKFIKERETEEEKGRRNGAEKEYETVGTILLSFYFFIVFLLSKGKESHWSFFFLAIFWGLQAALIYAGESSFGFGGSRFEEELEEEFSQVGNSEVDNDSGGSYSGIIVRRKEGEVYKSEGYESI